MLESLQSIIDIKPVLKEFLQHTNLALSEDEWKQIEEATQILTPCKHVVNAICREDADLMLAEIAFKKLFKTLEEYEYPLAKELLLHLKTEIRKRWHPNVAGLLKYLYNPSNLTNLEKEKRTKSKRSTIGNFFSIYKLFFATRYLTFVRYLVAEEKTSFL